MKEPKIYLKIGRKVYLNVNPKKMRSLVSAEAGTTQKRVYLRVVYGKEKGRLIDNEGIYDNKKDALYMMNAFLDKDLWLSN